MADVAAEPGDPRYLALLDRLRSLHVLKARDYGSDHDPLANLRAAADLGLPPAVGSWLRAKDKVFRIDAFFRKGVLANEGVDDSLMDLAAYALLTLVLLGESRGEKGVNP
jgi:hypothetical protein